MFFWHDVLTHLLKRYREINPLKMEQQQGVLVLGYLSRVSPAMSLLVLGGMGR